MKIAYAASLSVALALFSTSALGAKLSGFPTGVWRLNAANSKSMGARSQTLEIVSDDGRSLSFVLRQRQGGKTKVLKWSGTYGAAPHVIEGSKITLAVAHEPNHSIRIFGQRPGGVSYEELCRIESSRRRFRCDGAEWGSDGKKTAYVEIYELQQ
jgi:hypothetical protein